MFVCAPLRPVKRQISFAVKEFPSRAVSPTVCFPRFRRAWLPIKSRGESNYRQVLDDEISEKGEGGEEGRGKDPFRRARFTRFHFANAEKRKKIKNATMLEGSVINVR